MKKNFILFLLLLPSLLFGQGFKINLSPKHEQKLGMIKSGHKRMMSYYKFYKKDSAHHLKKITKRAKQYRDSLYKAELKGGKLKDELAKQGIVGDKQWEYAEGIRNEYKQLKQLLNDPVRARLQRVRVMIEKPESFWAFLPVVGVFHRTARARLVFLTQIITLVV